LLSSHPNHGMIVSLKLIRGDIANLTNASGNVTPAGAIRVCKIGFPDIIMPGDIRNDLFVTLERGEFERGGKTTPKNVLATISVFDGSGSIIDVHNSITKYIFVTKYIFYRIAYSVRPGRIRDLITMHRCCITIINRPGKKLYDSPFLWIGSRMLIFVLIFDTALVF
jgi:hypothetical protein